MIVLMCDIFENQSNALLNLVKLVYLQFYCFVLEISS